MLAARNRARHLARPAALRNRGSHHFAFADELRGESRSAAAFAGGATEDQSVTTIFHNRMGVPVSVSAGNLRNRLKSEHATASKFSQPRERIFETVNLSERVQLVDDEPKPFGVGIARSLGGLFVLIHGFEDREAHPSRNGRPQG